MAVVDCRRCRQAAVSLGASRESVIEKDVKLERESEVDNF
jgi:hypothetical protein